MTLTGTRGAAAVAVIGRDAMATGSAALELARAEARQRLVTIVDLIGDAPPLRRIVLTDDDHGVADCFAYGVSFTAVARQTAVGAVSLIPSGSEPLAYQETLASRRWERLIAQTRASGGLIVFAALAETPGLDALISRIDFAIPEGLVLPTGPVATPPAARVGSLPPRPRAPRVLAAPAPKVARRRVIGFAAAAAVIVVAGTSWAVRRSGAPSSSAPTATNGQRRDTLTSTAQLGVAERSPGNAGSGTRSDVADPEDSAIAAAFAIRVGTYPTYTLALRALRQEIKRGAATITPLPPSNATASSTGATSAQAYALYVGAAAAAATLDSTIKAWSQAGGFGGGTVTHAPYALRLTGRITPDSARRATVVFRSRGVPAYALDAADGRAAVYAGAFVTIEQATPLATSLKNAGLDPVLAYRVGLAP